MRRVLLVGSSALALVIGPVFTASGAVAAPAANTAGASVGTWSAPFEPDPTHQQFPIPADTSGSYFPGDSPNQAISSEYCYAGKPGDSNPADGPLVCNPTAVSVAVLPDGRLIYWDGLSGLENIQHATAGEAGAVSTNSQARILDLRSGTPQFSLPKPCPDGSYGGCATDPNADGQYVGGVPGPLVSSDSAAQGDMFCADLVMLGDGRLAIAGGTSWYEQPGVPGTNLGVVELEGLRNTRIFDPTTNSFMQAGNMNYGRWYPDTVELSSGDVFVAGGVRRLVTTDGTNVENWEIGHVTQAAPYIQWQDMGTSPIGGMPLFPRFHLLPDGTVYYSGAGQMWGPFGESADQAVYNLHRDYDPKSNAWTSYGIGTFGARSGAFSVLLPLKAPYSQAQVLVGGGTLGSPPGSYIADNFSEIATFNFNTKSWTQSGSPAFQRGPDLANSRWYSSAVTLPNDAVAVFNGANKDEVVDPGSESPVRMAEWYAPWDGQFHDLSAASRDRTYHNTAVLLPDGSVLVGGHAPIASGYGNYSNQVHSGTSALAAAGQQTANNFRDPSFEVYKPPYFYLGARPQIDEVQSGIAWGKSFTIGTDQASQVTSVRLIRLPSLTHIVDANMRSVDLPIVHRGGDSVTVQAPPTGSIAPSGYYYLFINSGSGAKTVPSTAAIVHVGSQPMGGDAPIPFKHTAAVATTTVSAAAPAAAPAAVGTTSVAASIAASPAALAARTISARAAATVDRLDPRIGVALVFALVALATAAVRLRRRT